MPATILSDNGVVSGTSGLKTSGSNDGQLELQTTTAGGSIVTAVSINNSQVVTLAQPLPVASGGTGSASGVNLATGVSGTLPVGNGGTGQTSLTANNVILGNGTSAVQFVAPGTNGNVLTSNGTTWQSTAPAGGGSWVYLNSFNPSGSTVFDMTGQFSATYDDYVLLYEGVNSSFGSETISCRLYVGGVLQTSGYWRAGFYLSNNNFGSTSGGGASSVPLLADTTGSTATTQSIAGQIWFYNVNSTTSNMTSSDTGYTQLENPGGPYAMWTRQYFRNATSGAITGIRIYWSSATFTSSSVFRLYGIKKS